MRAAPAACAPWRPCYIRGSKTDNTGPLDHLINYELEDEGLDHAVPPTEDDIAREIHRYALPRLPPQPEPAMAMVAAGGEDERKEWGIIEID